MDINEKIVNVAKIFLGQQEVRGNLGFLSSSDEILAKYKDILGLDMALSFEDMMKNVGWQKKQAWCAYYAELVWKLAYSSENGLFVTELDRLFSASAVMTFKNFEKAGWEINKKTNPGPGSLAVWQKYKNGKPHWSGHIGIYVGKNNDDMLRTIDGNTNDDGSREGYEVAEKTRRFNFNTNNGLRLIGFVEPKMV